METQKITEYHMTSMGAAIARFLTDSEMATAVYAQLSWSDYEMRNLVQNARVLDLCNVIFQLGLRQITLHATC